MVDMAMISGTMAALKSASEIAKTMIGIHDADVLRSKVAELQAQIVSAQSSALTAQADQFALRERVRELEKEAADLKAWEAEKQRYELKIVAAGATTYALKEDAGGSEPPHWICTACYQKGKKSIMQSAGQAASSGLGFRKTKWKCSSCTAELLLPNFTSPTKPADPSEM